MDVLVHIVARGGLTGRTGKKSKDDLFLTSTDESSDDPEEFNNKNKTTLNTREALALDSPLLTPSRATLTLQNTESPAKSVLSSPMRITEKENLKAIKALNDPGAFKVLNLLLIRNKFPAVLTGSSSLTTPRDETSDRQLVNLITLITHVYIYIRNI